MVKIIEQAIISKTTEMKDSMVVVFKESGLQLINMDDLKPDYKEL